MTIVAATAITITKRRRLDGSDATEWAVDVNGEPFGLIWTFTRAGEFHPYHAKPLNGDHAMFNSYREAEAYMRGLI